RASEARKRVVEQPATLRDRDLASRAGLQWSLKMATFHLLNFGCRASQADGAALKAQLLQAGLDEAPGAESSDLAVLNTCTVTAVADAEVRRVVRRIHRSNPRCRILVTGCYAQRAPHEIARLEGVAWVVGNSHKHAVAELVKTQFAPGEVLTRDEAAVSRLVQIVPRSARMEVSGV